MTSISVALFAGFGFSLITDVIASAVYLGWSYGRSNAANGAKDAFMPDVRFESVWCMILALPALLAVLAGVFGAGLWPGLLVAVLALYAIPALALAGRRLPAPARAFPAFVAIGTFPVLLVLGVVAAGGLLWLMVFPLIGSRLVVGYVADCKVGLRFLRAVEDYDGRQEPTRSFARYSSRVGVTPVASELAS